MAGNKPLFGNCWQLLPPRKGALWGLSPSRDLRRPWRGLAREAGLVAGGRPARRGAS